MAHLVWTDDLDTGIDVIDGQHQRIVDYINELHDACLTKDRDRIAGVIEDTVDYTLSHFGFEEALMEDAGYEFTRPHKKVHELFVRRVADLKRRFSEGEDVSEELHRLLSRWLFGHIRNDDRAYVAAVKAKTAQAEPAVEEKKKGWLSRFFGK